MVDKESLIAEYFPQCAAEYVRIGFTPEDFRYLASGGELTRERFEAALEQLRSVPSGIGADAYFARLGVDFAGVKRAAAQAESERRDDT
jgi:hypothetical protein